MAAASPDPGGDYASALSGLHRLLVDYQGAESFLRQAAVVTARTVGRGLMCSIMLQPSGRPLMAAASDPLATLAHQVQDSLGQGPGLRCLRWQHQVHIEDLTGDLTWPLFAQHAAGIGIRSCLCLLLAVPGMTGVLSLYAATPHAFGALHVSRAKTMAGYLSGAIILGARQDGLLATIDQLRGALASRAVIDQAAGVLIARGHCSSSQALATLRAAAHDHNVTLGDLARQIVDEASGGPHRRPHLETDLQAAPGLPGGEPKRPRPAR